jgi:hypothetical protein
LYDAKSDKVFLDIRRIAFTAGKELEENVK